ncbi:unnamed protein product [Choristocarpus tenellus]
MPGCGLRQLWCWKGRGAGQHNARRSGLGRRQRNREAMLKIDELEAHVDALSQAADRGKRKAIWEAAASVARERSLVAEIKAKSAVEQNVISNDHETEITRLKEKICRMDIQLDETKAEAAEEKDKMRADHAMQIALMRRRMSRMERLHNESVEDLEEELSVAKEVMELSPPVYILLAFVNRNARPLSIGSGLIYSTPHPCFHGRISVAPHHCEYSTRDWKYRLPVMRSFALESCTR